LLPAGAVAGWGLHPLESAAFPRRTPQAAIQAIKWQHFDHAHAITSSKQLGSLATGRLKIRR
jgi:hypothetical protein